jgi:steroid delta-isomerase-like uncharacterized protein
MAHAVTCSCGDVLSSEDEEELYSLIHAHAAQAPAEPHHPVPIQVAEHLPSTGAEAHKALVERWEEEVVNHGNLAAIDAELPARQAEGLKAYLTLLRTAFPDLHGTIENIVADEDKVALRSTLHGTHRGPFMGIAPTGKEVTVQAFDFFRVADDKIVEHWGSIEELDLLQQLGVLREKVKV